MTITFFAQTSIRFKTGFQSSLSCHILRIIVKRVSFLFLIILEVVAGDKDCFNDDIGQPIFNIYAGWGNENKAMDMNLCKQQCIEMALHFPWTKIKTAGIQENEFCFCAAEKIGDDKLQDCSEINEATISTKIYYLQLDEILKNVDDLFLVAALNASEIELNLALPEDVTTKIITDYGDGNPLCNETKHTYVLPGTYEVVAYVDYTEYDLTRTAYRPVEIQQKFDSKSFDIHCPDKAIFNTPIFCNINISSGSSLSIQIDISRKEEQIETIKSPLPDVPTYAFGQIANDACSQITISESQNKWVAMMDSMVTIDGIIKGIEIYGMEAGDISLAALKIENSCDDKLYSGAPFCIDPNVMKFKKEIETEVKFNVGYNYIENFVNIPVKFGDVIAFQIKSGNIGSRRIRNPDEVADYTGDNIEELKSSDHKHFVRVIIQSEIEIEFERVYETTGNYTIGFQILPEENNIPFTITVYEPITELKLHVEPKTCATGSDCMISATLKTGSDVNVDWIFLNKTENEMRYGNVSGTSFNKSYSFETEDDYEIIAIASNVGGELNETIIAYVEHPLVKEDCNFECDQLRGMTTGLVNFTVTCPALITTSRILMMFEWDDRSEQMVNQTFHNGSTTTFSISHPYTELGDFNATVKIYNNITEVYLSTWVNVAERLVITEVQAEYNLTERPKFRKGHGRNKNTFPKNSYLTFDEFIKHRGNVSIYRVGWGDGNFTNFSLADNPQEIGRLYVDEGVYNVTIEGLNDVQTSDKYEYTVYIKDFDPITIHDFDIITDQNETKYFQVEYDHNDWCLVVNYGDDSPFEKYGPKDICENRNDGIVYKSDVPDRLFNLTHVYKLRNYYTIITIIFNDKEEANTTLFFLVNNYHYEKPFVFIRVNSTDYMNPLRFRCGEGIKLDTQAILPHIYPSHYSKVISWGVQSVDPESGEDIISDDPLLKNCENSIITKSSLFVQPRCLKYGLYKITYYYNLTVTEMDPRYPIICDFFTYVVSTKSNINPLILPGNPFELTLSYNEIINLTPQQSSIDPDNLEDKDFNITWHCRGVHDSMLESDPVIDIDQIENKKSDSSSDSASGCFGHGPAYINVNKGNWELNTSLFYKPNNPYIITVFVQKDTRNGTSFLRLDVVTQRVAKLALKCGLPSLCRMMNEGIFINPNVRLSLEVECLENCDEVKVFQWEIFQFSSLQDVDGELVPDVENYTIGFREPFIAIKKELLEQEKNRYISVRATAIKSSKNNTARKKRKTPEENEYKNDLGSIGFRFIVNQPPVNGTCNVTEPDQKKTLIEFYDILCTGWMDPEDDGIGVYKIYTIDENNFKNVLVSSMDNHFAVILKPGKVKIMADVNDIIGTKVTVVIGEIEVQMVTKEEYEKFMTTKELDYILATGNQYQYMQAMQAMGVVASLLFATASNDTGNLVDLSESITSNLDRLEDVNVNTFEDAELILSTTSTVISDGQFLNRNGKNLALNILGMVFDKMAAENNSITFFTPLQASGLYTDAFSVLGGVSMSIANTVIQKSVIPGDMANADEFEYDGTIESDDSGGFALPTSVEEARARSVIEDARMESKKQAAKMKEIVDDVIMSVVKNFVPGESPLPIATNVGVAAYFISSRASESANITTNVGKANFELPDFCDLINNASGPCDVNVPFAVSAIIWPCLINVFPKSVTDVASDSQVLQLDVFTGVLKSDRSLPIKNSTEPIHIVIPRNSNGSDDSVANDTQPKMKWFEDMMYHQVTVKRKNSALAFEFSTEAMNRTHVVYFRYDKKPVLDNYELKWVVDFSDPKIKNNTYSVYIKKEMLNERVGNYYFGVTQLVDNFIDLPPEPWNSSIVNRNWTDSYVMSTISADCWYFDYVTNEWNASGCAVIDANPMETHCLCTHLTPFGSGLVVAPNPIDFNYVFANASFADNLTIYITIIITLTLFIIFLIWARYKDKKDLEKLGALPLPDNNAEHKYIYEILVFTSDVQEATCDSKISFILCGDKDETEIRSFGNPHLERKVFRRNGADIFVMTVPRPLGQLQLLRIWHDNSGKSSFASWNLNYIIFRDVQTGEKFEFIGNVWLALEKDDGQIDRTIAVADKETLTQFDHLFTTTSRKNLTDGHLWFSVFLRPPRSRFTRCQRVCSCVALLYLSMLVNAMWYGTIPDKPSKSALNVGPFHLSPEQIAVGVFSNLIIFPPSFLIIFFFRKARPRTLRPSRINEAIKKQHQHSLNEESKKTAKENENASNVSYTSENKMLKFKRKKKFTLPWWFSIIAWILCVSCILLSVFFLWAYGIQFGNEKTKKWMTSLIIAFFSSILISQPIKVFLVAMFMSAICKKVETDEDDADEDEEDPDLNDDEEWLHKPFDPTKPQMVTFSTRNSEEVEKAREIRQKEVKMGYILKEVLLYFLFVWLLIVINYGLVNQQAILMHNTLLRQFIKPGSDTGFLKIDDIDNYWRWAENMLIPNLRIQRDYAGHPPYGLKGFLNDRVNRIMGYAIMRQERLKPGTCNAHRMVKDAFKCTGIHTDALEKDTSHYRLRWKPNATGTPINDIEGAFRFKKPRELDSYPVVARISVYLGGGYVYKLNAFTKEILADFKELRKNNWIDEYTQALFVEFSVYNAQVNLFGVVSIYAEFGPGGSLFPEYNIEAIDMMPTTSNSSSFVWICRLLYYAFIIYFTIIELRKICTKRREYFRNISWISEWLIIILSFVALTVFILRALLLAEKLEFFKKTSGNEYINLQKCQYLNSLIKDVMAIVSFLAIIKFIKLLRFNKRMSALADTLKQCASDLKGFGFVVVFVFIAFGQLFYLIFFKNSDQFSGFSRTLSTMISLTLNRFDFDTYNSNVSLIGPIVFFGFSFMISIILMNLFLTIILISFESIKHDIKRQSNEFQMASFMFGRIKRLFNIGNGNRRNNHSLVTPSLLVEDKSNPTADFPKKVDLLLQHINSVYFDGKLDLNSKEMMYRNKKLKFGTSNGNTRVFQSDI